MRDGFQIICMKCNETMFISPNESYVGENDIIEFDTLELGGIVSIKCDYCGNETKVYI